MHLNKSYDPIWWELKRDEIHQHVLPLVERLEDDDSNRLELYRRNAKYYEGRERSEGIVDALSGYAQVQENVIAQTTDLMTALVGSNQPAPTFQTKEADFMVAQRAKLKQQFVQTMFKECDVYPKGKRIFKDACVKGFGALKIYAVDGEIRADRIPPHELFWDTQQARWSPPTSMHWRRAVDKSDLIAQFPKYEQQIRDAHVGGEKDNTARLWGRYTALGDEQVIVVESIRLPLSKKKPGRHTICIDGATLYAEKWTRKDFGMAFFHFEEGTEGFDGISLAERLVGIQAEIYSICRKLRIIFERVAVPRIAMHERDQHVRAQFSSTIGHFILYRHAPPTLLNYQGQATELLNRLFDLRTQALNYGRLNQLTAQVSQLSRADSSKAVRELHDSQMGAVSTQAVAYEKFFLDCAALMVQAARVAYKDNKDLKASWRSRNLAKLIQWDQCDLDEDKYQLSIEAASLLTMTPSHRQATIKDWLALGIISPERGAQLMGSPDVAEEQSMIDAARDDVDWEIDKILGSKPGTPPPVPNPHQNLGLAVEVGTKTFLRTRHMKNVPMHVLDNLDIWTQRCQKLASQTTPQMTPQPGDEVPQMAPDAMQMAPPIAA